MEDDIDQDELERDIAAVMADLPAPVRAFLHSPRRAEVARTITAKYYLHIDQAAVVEREMILMLLGVEQPTDFTATLAETGLDSSTIEGITNDVNAMVFQPLQDQLRALQAGSSAPMAPVQPSVPQPQAPPPVSIPVMPMPPRIGSAPANLPGTEPQPAAPRPQPVPPPVASPVPAPLPTPPIYSAPPAPRPGAPSVMWQTPVPAAWTNPGGAAPVAPMPPPMPAPAPQPRMSAMQPSRYLIPQEEVAEKPLARTMERDVQELARGQNSGFAPAPQAPAYVPPPMPMPERAPAYGNPIPQPAYVPPETPRAFMPQPAATVPTYRPAERPYVPPPRPIVADVPRNVGGDPYREPVE